jgi:NhaP-type Na+/H+ or K+/H+ antiporter
VLLRAFAAEWHIFKRLLWQILALAVPGVVLSTVLTAVVFK